MNDDSTFQFTVVNATTAAPSFVPAAITPSPRLEAITRWVLIQRQTDGLYAAVYRQSGKALGRYSRNFYLWNGAAWEPRGKDDEKHDHLPSPPLEARKCQVCGVDFWTMELMTEEERVALLDLLPLLQE